ncbi:hypothetical protein BD560DRAFT_381446 [Blakeslea trispora]|nr:hypothetical protein BD560DRAFT_381446 [Blakeslea trispora]
MKVQVFWVLAVIFSSAIAIVASCKNPLQPCESQSDCCSGLQCLTKICTPSSAGRL